MEVTVIQEGIFMTKYDVIVAGAGAMGMSAGYFLAKKARRFS